MVKTAATIILVICMTQFIFAQAGYDRIFVVDVSGSMLKDNLYTRVQKSLINYIKNCSVGDRIILMSFGSDVNPGIEDRILYESTIGRDIGEITSKINRFKFEDKWTWMTKAFDVIGNRLRDLQKGYPDRPKRVYVFTDGLNDPPPDKKDFLTFADVLRLHSMDFDTLDTYIYLIILGVKPDTITKRFIDSIGGEIVDRERGDTILYQEIALSPSNIQKTIPFNKKIKLEWELEVRKLVNITSAKIYFNILKHDFTQSVQLIFSPETISCEKIGQKIPMQMQISNITNPGTYNITLKPQVLNQRSVFVDPARLTISLNLSQTIVKVSPSQIGVSGSIKDNRTKFRLTFENQGTIGEIPAEIVMLSVEPTKILKIEPKEFKILQGKSSLNFVLNYKGFDKGNYKYNLELKSLNPDVKFDPAMINLQFKVFSPVNPILFLLLILIIIALVLVVFSFYRIHKFFGEWTIAYGSDFEPKPMNIYKPFLSPRVVVGEDVFSEFGEKVLEVFAKFDSPFTGHLYAKVLGNLNIEELRSDVATPLKEFTFSYRGERLTISKNR